MFIVGVGLDRVHAPALGVVGVGFPIVVSLLLSLGGVAIGVVGVVIVVVIGLFLRNGCVTQRVV